MCSVGRVLDPMLNIAGGSSMAQAAFGAGGQFIDQGGLRKDTESPKSNSTAPTTAPLEDPNKGLKIDQRTSSSTGLQIAR